jgi:hypothetical protein
MLTPERIIKLKTFRNKKRILRYPTHDRIVIGFFIPIDFARDWFEASRVRFE